MNRKSFTTAIFIFLISVHCANAEKIVFSADSMSGTVGDKSDSTTLEGEAYVLTESMEISADKITMYGQDFRYIEAMGSVDGKNMESELEFTCGKLKYDRETKIALLSEGVNLKDIKNDVTVKGHLIEYNQNTDIAVMQIDIELLQKDNVCTGVYAVYRKNEQMLELSGNAQIKQGSDTFRAQHITMNLDSQEIILDGRVKGSVVDERKSEDADATGETTGENAETPEGNENAENTENTEGVEGETKEAGESAESSENANAGESASKTENNAENANADKAVTSETVNKTKNAKSKKSDTKNNSTNTTDNNNGQESAHTNDKKSSTKENKRKSSKKSSGDKA